MNMKKVSVDVWIQLIGMLGVLGGLVFVGLEIAAIPKNSSSSTASS